MICLPHVSARRVQADPALAAEGSLLLEQPSAHCRVSEWEQALLGAPPYRCGV